MSMNNYILLGYAQSGDIGVQMQDADSGFSYGETKYFKSLKEALDYCKGLLPEVEYGIQLGRGFGE